VARRTLLSMFFYAHYGQVSYCVGPVMREAFERTRLGSVPEGSLRTPYPTFYIALPECPWLLWGGETGWHQCGGIYVRGDEDTVSIIAWGKENEKSNRVGDDATFWADINLKEVPRVSRPGDSEKWLDLDSYISTLLHSNRAQNDPGMGAPLHARGEMIRNALPLLRIVFALILYLGSVNAEEDATKVNDSKKRDLETALGRLKNPNKSKGQRLRRQLDALAVPTVIWVGRSIETREGGCKRPQGNQKFHYRPGYFNHYWTGLRKDATGQPIPRTEQKRVRKWIEGYWVNKDTRNETDPAAGHGKIVRFREDWIQP